MSDPQDHASAVQCLKQALLKARPEWKGRIWVRFTKRDQYRDQITVTVRNYCSFHWWMDDGEVWWRNRWNHTFDEIAANVLDELTDHERHPPHGQQQAAAQSVP
jgi:hypothetical protein